MEVGRDVCRGGALNEISPCMYISQSYICPIPFIWKELFRDVFRPVRVKWDSGSLNKSGQFLSYKHLDPLCRYDIMHIVLGEIVPDRSVVM